jgi:hypothetical protein
LPQFENKSSDYTNFVNNTKKQNHEILEEIDIAKRRMSYVSLNPNLDGYKLDLQKSKRRIP